MNSVDVLEDKFPTLSAVSEKEIKERLNDIFFTKTNFYEKDTGAIRKILISGINKINNETLRAFIK